jgi:hypothetical protein
MPSMANSFSRIGFADECMETRTFPIDIVSGIDGVAQRFPTDTVNNNKMKDFFKRDFKMIQDKITKIFHLTEGLSFYCAS